jgi:hypothetical protein
MHQYFGAGERRITLRMLAYWEKMRGARPMPHEDDINPDDIGDLWDNCFLIHVKDLEKKDYQYTYLGEDIKKAFQGGLSTTDTNGMVSPNAVKLADCYNKIIRSCEPIVDEGEFTNNHGDIVKYRQCLMPLGENGKVDAIFGAMRYKVMASQTA